MDGTVTQLSVAGRGAAREAGSRRDDHKRRATGAALAIGTVLSLIVGCGGSEHPAPQPRQTASTNSAAAQRSLGKQLHVVARLTTSPASSLLATPDSLWVLGGPSGVLTKVDPATNSVVRKVRTPHPPGFGTYADGSLWIASLLDSVLMELDADTGRVLRTIESKAGKPFYRPIGVAATGKDLWVLNHGDESVRSTLARLDPRSGAVTGTTDLPGHHASGPLLAAGHLWITLTTESTVVRVDPATGRIVGTPILVDTGTCLSASVADGDPWYTGLEAEDGSCHDAARRVDARSAELSPVVYGLGKSLVNFASAGGSVWASDIGHTLYQVDVKSGAIRPSLTLDDPDAPNQLLVAFGSIWVLGGPIGRLTRVDLS
jgi:streptogramin lyase